jgi:hypothetical protein
MTEIPPPSGESQNYRDGWADGMAGNDPDAARTAGGATRLNDYERGYIDSGEAERATLAAGGPS